MLIHISFWGLADFYNCYRKSILVADMSAPRKRTSEDPPDVEYIGEEKRCSDSGDGGSHTGSPGIDQGASQIMKETNLGHQDTIEYLETGLLGRKR